MCVQGVWDSAGTLGGSVPLSPRLAGNCLYRLPVSACPELHSSQSYHKADDANELDTHMNRLASLAPANLLSLAKSSR
jgi:hypothetical protein